MDWDKLRVFHVVAGAGSLTHAGETLHLSQSAVSRQVSALEDMVGAPLFHRHPRGLILTSEGELLFEATKHMAAELSQAAARIRDARETVRGALRITTTVGFGTVWLSPRFPALFERHPGLTIDLELTERVVDIAMREADVAIRMRAPVRADVIQKELGKVRVRLYATQSYLDQAGTPESIADLARHRLIAYRPNAPQPVADLDWLTRGRRALKPILMVNSHYGMMQAVRSGLGVAPLPDYIARDAPGLMQILPDAEGPEYAISLVYAVELRNSKRIGALRDFLSDEIAASDGFAAPSSV